MPLSLIAITMHLSFVELLTAHYTFQKFYVIIEFFGRLWVQNWISCAITLISSMVYDYSVFVCTLKFLVSVTFSRITKLTPALFWLNRKSSETTPELQWLLPVIYWENCEYEFFEYIILCYYFSKTPFIRTTFIQTFCVRTENQDNKSSF